MRRYETIVIIDPDLPEDDRTAVLTRIQEIIPQQEGIFLQEDLWGVKKLAYDIKKKPRGYYARIDYCGTGKVVDELERFFRIDDRIMKYLTVQLDSDADAEQIKAQIEEAKAKVVQETPEEPTVDNKVETPQENQSPAPTAPAQNEDAGQETQDADATASTDEPTPE